jgi:glycosyltransferase involved in cell wall biosynthesis
MSIVVYENVFNKNERTILYIGSDLPDQSAAAHRVFSNGKALRDYGYEVVFLSTKRNLYKKETTLFENFEIHFINYPKNIVNWIKHIVSIENEKKLISRYNNIYAVIYYDCPAIVLYRLKNYCKKNKIAVVSDCAEWHTVSHLKGIKRIIKFMDINLRIRFVQKKMDGLIGISSFWTDLYKNKIMQVTVPPLIDKLDKKWGECQKTENNVKKFVYAGNMGNEKDRLNLCIDALYKIKNKSFLFNIIGITKEQYLKKFESHRELLKDMENKIVFHGYIPHCDVLEHIKKSDFSILIRENIRKNNAGFPTKLGESIACGTPVIASDFSDVRQYVEKYQLGILIDTVNDIYSGLERAISMNNDELEKLKQNCLNCNAFDYRNYVNILGNFVEQICGELGEHVNE